MKKIHWLLLMSFFFCLCACLFYLNGWRANVVLTNSMAPTVPKGSLVITKPLLEKEPLVGKIVLFYYSPFKAYVLHRVQGETITLETKGDANIIHDPVTISRANVRGVYVMHIPLLGAWLNVIKSYAWLIVLLFLLFWYRHLLVCVFLVLFPFNAHATFQSAAATPSYVTTGSSFFFYYLLDSTSTKQPSNQNAYVSTGRNATLALDVGTVSGVVNFQTTVSNVFTITNKTNGTRTVSLTVQNVSRPPLSLVGIGYIVSVPASFSIAAGDTVSVPLKIAFLPLLSIPGTYRGVIVISDGATGLSFQVPITLQVNLL
ncbi:signal peptidase I [Anoxybacteroides amylolyticum]|uniref:Signal peptidase I n=1 Tax=Anoxybacteroides amylolyticum TaxID=294699 RepID=A0A160F463_9BACL|nr:signal peptidase I [Anoxybacillus amylolyticus]ANB60672.1 signal peptidase I [Anoxybacillus amylolyticus]